MNGGWGEIDLTDSICCSAWRPLEQVENWPLAVCDGSSITYDDLIEVDLIRKDYIGSTMFAKFRPGYSWYYLESQRPDEVCLFKNFDSQENSKAPICPHSSFEQDDVPLNTRPRKSIEVRAFVFGGPQQRPSAAADT
ncbi:methyltransferase CmcJ [Colletotrichum higginsianum]|uniref:Methyltransferase CmcJ n=1 Tax=Colletotrichum higginsianum (strain IMI 349063) TaxID=759273 RepID=H1UUU8_COLHI|nr:Methyltransferase CmcJ [Colletotrichum higginsianum IMI 349063]OBR04182.1 Methyltransferase CmcJ [Colletotrichum higginsianum IMI 349063]CCF31749.1 methyltransferase CmcJ [Colletotrichum higginsianum]